MAHSLTWNGTAFSAYGLIVRLATPAPTLSRTYNSMQTQDRAWAGKGQGAPSVFNLPVIIFGTSSANLLTRVSTVRGLLDQEDDCTLAFDMYTDRSWLAKFDSMEGDYTSDTTWEGFIIFTCHDRTAYALAASSQTETLTENISADYGGEIRAICYDDDYVYVAGVTTDRVRKLSKIDLSLVATGPDYGGDIFCLCEAGGYIYYGGNGGAGEYDMCKLLKSDMTTIVRGPDYGGIIYACAEYGNFVYYGGNGGAGQYDIVKLDKATMAVEVRSVDYGGVISQIRVNATHVFAAGAAQRVKRYLITDLSYVDQSDDYGSPIQGLAIDDDNCYFGSGLDEIWRVPLTDLTDETKSAAGAATGCSTNRLAVDDDYLYAIDNNGYVFKFEKEFTAGASYVAKSAAYGGSLWAIAIDTVNDWLFIGGATTQTVWKLDSRHLEELASSEDIGTGIRACASDENYIYTLQGTYLVKLRKSDLTILNRSIDYGGVVWAVAEYGDYIFIGGATTQKCWKLSKDSLEKVAESADYGGSIYAIDVIDENYVFIGGGTTGVARKLSYSDLSFVANSANYGEIYALKADSTNIYIAGDAVAPVVRKLLYADLSFVADSANYGGIINALAIATTYIYCGGETTETVLQITKATMATNATSASLGDTIHHNALAVDSSFVYVGTSTLWKIALTDMSIQAQAGSATFTGFSIGTGELYATAFDLGYIYKFDTRVLWQRSDHEITLTSAGTAKCGLDFASTASQDNYWMQTYGNQTTGDEWAWEGTQDSGEELEVDSELWYCTLEGDSAMSGVSGEFLTLSPGANVLYLENVTGVVVFDWTDRFA